MQIQALSQSVREVKSDALIIGVVRGAGDKGLLLTASAKEVDTQLAGSISESYTTGEFKGNLGELLTLHSLGRLVSRRVIIVGLGSEERVNGQSIRRASAIAARYAQNTGAQQIVLALQGNGGVEVALAVQAEVEGALLGLYSFRSYQSNGKNGNRVSQIQVLSEGSSTDEFEDAIHKGQALAEATNTARDLINEPPNVLTPTELANRAKAMAERSGLECEVFDKSKITELGMGGLLAVSKGSAEPPQFIILRYRGAGDQGEKGVALVGKGITFDTGGISLKPAAGMDEMKGDMGGAAAVIGAMQAIAALKPNINVTGLVPTCENRPSSTSYLPGDILRILNGKTIEIVNTDAEGRLVLADALSYAVQENLSPIVDLATLTGGIVVALGHIFTGLFCNDEQLSSDIIAAGKAAGEKYWPMPLDDDYKEQISSEVADIKQTGGRAASSVTAAKILENFVGGTSWAHLDIAGTSFIEGKKPYQEHGATGVGVRTLAELVLKRAK
ncbi:MAG TPA: leucyl aminopeptidase [Ktedonobacteraceae bacterium]|jgi:leucyl aminopeptidase|nr:leucyl aminopeptidase [Ktedonobacteraceae bacterium]